MSCISECNTAYENTRNAASATRDTKIAEATTAQQIIDAENAFLATMLQAAKDHADCVKACPEWVGGNIDTSLITCCPDDP